MHQHLSHQIPRLFCVFSYLTTRGDSSTQNCLMTPHSICLWVYLAIREAHKNGPIIGTFSALDFNSRSKMNWKIQFPITTQCLKINEKVSFIIASEASYVYMLTKVGGKCQKWDIFGWLSNNVYETFLVSNVMFVFVA